MKPPFAYYGGKSRLAPWIVSLFPSHRVYVEPFAGSAAVLFAKPRSTHEVINDLDDEVVNFMRVLRERPEDLEAACLLSPYARTEFEACVDLDAAGDDVERARRWWVRSTQAFAQVHGVNTGWSTSVERGSNNARSVWNRLGRFAAAAQRLGPVVIEHRDALEVIDRYDTPDGVIYCDPPYVGATRSSVAGGRRPGGDYPHEFHTDDQHRALAAALNAATATVLVSGYPSPLYDEIFDGWHTAHRVVPKRASNGRSAPAKATETIWCNRPLLDRLELHS